MNSVLGEALVNDGITEESSSESPQRSLPRFIKKRPIGAVLVGVVLLGTLGFLGFRAGAKPEQGKEGAESKRSQVTPVLVATATQKSVPIQIQAIGNVQASSTVAVTPQAAGRITGVFFKKGQDVEKGQLLFTLDDRSQRAALQQAQGNLAKDLAVVNQAKATLARDLGQVEQARATVEKDIALVNQAKANLARDLAQARYAQSTSSRYDSLYRQGAISRDQAQQFSANNQSSSATTQASQQAIANAEAVLKSDRVAVQNAQAVVEGDRAAIANAEAVADADRGALNNANVLLSYTKIYAPISGRAGNVLVTEGNVVQANSTAPLANITKTRPIQVAFSVPEANLAEVQRRLENGKLRVDVGFANGNGKTMPGVLSFINNTVDNTTGTVQLIGDFDNADGKLWPGQFVNATLTLKTEANATVIPAQAVQNGPNGQFVFVAKADNTVENAPVKVGSTYQGLAVVQQGVNPGDRVVTDGQANLVTGSKIRVKTSANSKGSQKGSQDDSSTAPTDSKATDSKASDNPSSGQKATDSPTEQPQKQHRRHRKPGGDS
jgi:membrane fusion protein, multidrug efflux system